MSLDTASEEIQTQVQEIWKFFCRPQDLHENDTWPCYLGSQVKEYLKPPTILDCERIPDSLAAALDTDLRLYSRPIECAEHFAFYMQELQIREMHSFWQMTLHRILVQYAGCVRPRTSGTMVNCIVRNIAGMDYRDPNDGSTESRDSDRSNNEKECESLDLNGSIKVMTTIFPYSDPIGGEEDTPLKHKMTPILEQMDASKIPPEHRVTVLFTLLTGKARDTASKIRSGHESIDTFLEELYKLILYEPNIQQRKINRWQSIHFGSFKAEHPSLHESSSRCIDHISAHSKDLPPHMCNSLTVLQKMREVFYNESWCQSIYEKSLPTMDPDSFAELIKTAAANQDRRSKTENHSKGTSSYTTSTAPQIPINDLANLVVHFFSRTPPPPRVRGPYRFDGRYRQRKFKRAPYPIQRHHKKQTLWLPLRNSNGRRAPRCYSCQQPGHIARNCPQRRRSYGRLTHLKNLGTGATMLIEAIDTDQPPSEDLDEVAAFIADHEEQHENDDSDGHEQFDT
ncbi:hypothetical protein FGB62_20g18 [Gracilaria domingensis]|nr:hypothetical protein FGB62_20g18 [Gracilaria domingensis]